MGITSELSSPWEEYQKVLFRFAFIFFILFIVLLDWSVNPIFTQLYYYGYLATTLDAVIHWVGKKLFHIQHVIISPYDGEHNDRTYVYLLYFIISTISFIATMVWSFVARKSSNHEFLYYWLTVVLRYYLAFTMFLFALEKFFKMQFPDLGYYTLTEQVGDMSPMHLAWAFFGYSYGYNVFIGLAESAALLLLFRRTMAVGAIISMGTLANVIVVNYNYDVHAKMYPLALFMMALFLFLHDAKKIIRFFFSNQAIALSIVKAPVLQGGRKMLKTIIKYVVIGYFFFYHVTNYLSYKKSADEILEAKSAFSGLFDVKTFVLNNDTLSYDDPARWHQIIIGDRMLEAVRYQRDSVGIIKIPFDKDEIILYGDMESIFRNKQNIYAEKGFTDNTWIQMDSLLIDRQIASSLPFELLDSTTLKLQGMIKNDSVFIHAKRSPIDMSAFRLMKRSFHWLNEASYFY